MDTIRLKPADFFFERLANFKDEDENPNTEMIAVPAIYKNKINDASFSLDISSEFIGLVQNKDLQFVSFDFEDESYYANIKESDFDSTWIHRSFCDLYHLQDKKEICEVGRKFYAVFRFYHEGHEYVLLKKTPNGYDFPSTEGTCPVNGNLMSRDFAINSIYKKVFKRDETISISFIHEDSSFINRRVPLQKLFYKNRHTDLITEDMVILADENIVPILVSDIKYGIVKANCKHIEDVLL